MKRKICKNCGEEKNIEDFNKHRDYSDGYTNMCKECRNQREREIYGYKKRAKKETIDVLNSKMNVVYNSVKYIFGVDFNTNSRVRPKPDARFIFSKIASEKIKKINQQEIADFLSLQNHSAVNYHIKQFNNLIGFDKNFKQKYEDCLSIVPDFDSIESLVSLKESIEEYIKLEKEKLNGINGIKTAI